MVHGHKPSTRVGELGTFLQPESTRNDSTVRECQLLRYHARKSHARCSCCFSASHAIVLLQCFRRRRRSRTRRIQASPTRNKCRVGLQLSFQFSWLFTFSLRHRCLPLGKVHNRRQNYYQSYGFCKWGKRNIMLFNTTQQHCYKTRTT